MHLMQITKQYLKSPVSDVMEYNLLNFWQLWEFLMEDLGLPAPVQPDA